VEKAVLRKYLSSEAQHTVYEVEVLGLSLAAGLMIMHGNDWVRQPSHDLGHHLVDRVHECIEALQCRHRSIAVKHRWTLGHEGLLENKHADAKAKKAA